MQTIGLIGGLSWESTSIYYRIINEEIKQKLGGLHSAKIILWSFDFAEIGELQHNNCWDKIIDMTIEAANSLKNAGADFLAICSNTMHKVALEVTNNINLPLLHLAEATTKVIQDNGINSVGMLGTKFTMEESFNKKILKEKGNITTLIPNDEDRSIIHQIIYNELCLGITKEESRQQYLEIINKMIDKGAEGIILGCTEIGLIIKQKDCTIPIFDTCEIHAKAISEKAIG